MATKKQPKPVVVMSAVLVALDVLTAGLAIVPGIPGWVVGLCVLLVAAVTAGWASYVHNQVTPYERVGARRLPDGTMVAGPAALRQAHLPAGPMATREGDEVDVLKATAEPL